MYCYSGYSHWEHRSSLGMKQTFMGSMRQPFSWENSPHKVNHHYTTWGDCPMRTLFNLPYPHPRTVCSRASAPPYKGSGQLVPKTTRTQDNSYPGQLVPKTTRTQDNSYPRQLVPRTTRTHVVWYDMKWCDMIWCDAMWCDMMWYDMMWYHITNDTMP